MIPHTTGLFSVIAAVCYCSGLIVPHTHTAFVCFLRPRQGILSICFLYVSSFLYFVLHISSHTEYYVANKILRIVPFYNGIITIL